MGSSFADIIGLSITGILVVMFGLALLSLAVYLFKFFMPGAQQGSIAKENNETEKEQAAVEKVHDLDEDQIAAIATAVMIEWKLYHEEPCHEFTFDYKGERLSSWTTSEYFSN